MAETNLLNAIILEDAAFQYLYGYYSDSGAITNKLHTKLFAKAVEANMYDRANWLKTKNNSINVNFKPDGKKTIAHLAAVKGDRQMADLIIELAQGNKSPIFGLDDYNGTVLQAAAFYGNVAFATAMFAAVDNGRLSPYDVGINYGNNVGESAFILAARQNQVAMLTLLKEKGANTSGTAANGYSALHKAAGRGNLEAVKYLVNNCEDLIDGRTYLVRTKHPGYTPLQIAVDFHQQKIVDFFDSLPVDRNILKAFAEERRGFSAYLDFKNNVDKVAADFNIFSLNGPSAAWLQDSLVNASLPGILKLSVIALNATFEQFCLKLAAEAFKRCIDQDRMNPDWTKAILQQTFPGSNRALAFKWDDFDPNKAIAEKEVYSACLEFRSNSSSNGPAVKKYLQHYLDKYTEIPDIQPKLSTGINAYFKDLFKWGDSKFSDSFQRQNAHPVHIWTSFGPNATSKTLTVADGKLFDVLAKMSRLFYGMRCVFAHGDPTVTREKTLKDLTFVADDFTGSDAADLATFFQNLATTLQNDDPASIVITYVEYVACLRIQKLLAREIHHAVKKAIEIIP